MPQKRNFKDKSHKDWSLAVMKRDGFTCQHPGCGKKKLLNAHHIKRYSNFPNLRSEISNGVTLCRMHHRATFGREEDFEQLYTNIVNSKIKSNPEISRYRYTGRSHKNII